MGAQIFTSRTLNDTLNPKWNFNCQFHIKDLYQDVLCITIFERDQFSPDGQSPAHYCPFYFSPHSFQLWKYRHQPKMCPLLLLDFNLEQLQYPCSLNYLLAYLSVSVSKCCSFLYVTPFHVFPLSQACWFICKAPKLSEKMKLTNEFKWLTLLKMLT